ncbi:MAG: Wzz/FepE/Etk N-terminal domain-containing protein [Clostridiales bacterium]|nr:Wzz/FepE/Etk N-terminal domain-containing protein [Clostridiales bacterium]
MKHVRKFNRVDLGKIALACLKRWKQVILVTALCAGGALLFTVLCIPPTYASTVQIYVNNSDITESSTSVSTSDLNASGQFAFDGRTYAISYGALSRLLSRTDRGTDALAYLMSVLPAARRQDTIGPYWVIRTDHRFHPHYRRKIYRYGSSFCADVPYGYLNLYANAALTLSDRVHACAVTLAFGNSAMLFAKTDRARLLARVGAEGITEHPVRLDRNRLEREKAALVAWLAETLGSAGRPTQE